MSKDPAFLFYPNDWLGGTMGMTFEEKGAYIELLILQFNRGHMTGHMIGQTVGQLWVKLQDKFKTDDDGNYYNERLEYEIKKRQEYCSSRLNNPKGINQYTGEKRSYDRSYDRRMTGHTGGHTENENININKGGVGGNKFIKPTIEEVAAYCTERGKGVNPQKWLDHYEANGWMCGKTKMKDWKAAVRTWEPEENPATPSKYKVIRG